jgi:hypothetical protein
MSRDRRALLSLLLVAGLLMHGVAHAWAEVAGPRVSHADLAAPGPPDSSVALPGPRAPEIARPGRAVGDVPRARDFELRAASLAEASTRSLTPGPPPHARSQLVRFARRTPGRGDPDDPPH